MVKTHRHTGPFSELQITFATTQYPRFVAGCQLAKVLKRKIQFGVNVVDVVVGTEVCHIRIAGGLHDSWDKTQQYNEVGGEGAGVGDGAANPGINWDSTRRQHY